MQSPLVLSRDVDGFAVEGDGHAGFDFVSFAGFGNAVDLDFAFVDDGLGLPACFDKAADF